MAISNLTALCREHAPRRHDIEVVDVNRNRKRALADGILMTPTLLKLAPAPLCRIVGALSQDRVLMQTLGLDATGA